MPEAYIIDAIRTPVGALGGALAAQMMAKYATLGP
jgi:hypothetical protein